MTLLICILLSLAGHLTVVAASIWWNIDSATSFNATFRTVIRQNIVKTVFGLIVAAGATLFFALTDYKLFHQVFGVDPYRYGKFGSAMITGAMVPILVGAMMSVKSKFSKQSKPKNSGNGN